MCRVCSLLFEKEHTFKAFRKVQRPQVQPVLAEDDNEVYNFELSNSKSVSPEKCEKQAKRGSIKMSKTKNSYFSQFFIKWEPHSKGTYYLPLDCIIL